MGQERAASLLPTLVKYEFALVQLFGLWNEVDVRPPGLLHVLETLRAFGVPHIALRLNATGSGRHKRAAPNLTGAEARRGREAFARK